MPKHADSDRILYVFSMRPDRRRGYEADLMRLPTQDIDKICISGQIKMRRGEKGLQSDTVYETSLLAFSSANENMSAIVVDSTLFDATYARFRLHANSDARNFFLEEFSPAPIRNALSPTSAHCYVLSSRHDLNVIQAADATPLALRDPDSTFL
ncbi:hypothetical protein EV356DRAFT_562586 [Viridothelium virens]|uniref:Uncharacterized protein n=1 Tax=Viridothelium virens TaxID=1048519 RepID=A0A6A6HQK7_VIRVR|nr:hypothetical protein EV356DRAFT_562586 [Viridothelium virens]